MSKIINRMVDEITRVFVDPIVRRIFEGVDAKRAQFKREDEEAHQIFQEVLDRIQKEELEPRIHKELRQANWKANTLEKVEEVLEGPVDKQVEIHSDVVDIKEFDRPGIGKNTHIYFKNGYGASILPEVDDKNKYEVGVLTRSADGWELTSEDVIRNASKEELLEKVDEVRKLPAKEHQQVKEQLEQEVSERVEKESPHVEVEGKELTFKEIKGEDLIFKDQQNTQYRVDPRKLPLSLETQGLIRGLHQLRQMSKEEIRKAIQEAQKEAKKTGRSTQEVFSEKIRTKIMKEINRDRNQLVSTAKELSKKIKTVNQDLVKQRAELRKELDELNKNKGSLSKEQYEAKIERINEKREKINEKQEELEIKEQQMTDKLRREIQTVFPGLKVDHMTLEDALLTAECASTREYKNVREFLSDIKERGQQALFDMISQGLDNKEKEREEIEIIEERITIER
jgi:hypothetical protein